MTSIVSSCVCRSVAPSPQRVSMASFRRQDAGGGGGADQSSRGSRGEGHEAGPATGLLIRRQPG